MLESILTILTEDDALRLLFGRPAKGKGTALTWLYLRETTDLRDCMLYDYFTTGADGAVERGRMQLTIIAETPALIRKVELRVKQLLLKPDDRPLRGNRVLKCVQNGGGSLTDTDRNKIHQYLYFDLVGRPQKG